MFFVVIEETAIIYKVFALPVEAGPVAPDAGGELRAGRLHCLEELVGVKRAEARRPLVGRDVPLQRHQRRDVTLLENTAAGSPRERGRGLWDGDSLMSGTWTFSG